MKSYLQWFNNEMVGTEGVTDEAALMAMMGRLYVETDFWNGVHRHELQNLKEFRRRV